jgi:hypothetical protein
MIESAQIALRKTLRHLLTQQARIEKEIQAVKIALAAVGGTTVTPSAKLLARRHRKPMTAAEKKSVSRRMKAYWAKRRAAKTSSQ